MSANFTKQKPVAPVPANGAAMLSDKKFTLQTFLGRHGRFWITFISLSVAVILFMAFLLKPASGPQQVGALKIGQIAPNFSLKNAVTGESAQLSQYRGHPVMLNFWATTCSACVTEFPLLERTYISNQSKGLVILGIDQGEEIPAIASFGQNYGTTYPLLADIQLSVNKAYGVSGLPVTYFIDASGVIRYASIGILKLPTLTAGLKSIGIVYAPPNV